MIKFKFKNNTLIKISILIFALSLCFLVISFKTIKNNKPSLTSMTVKEKLIEINELSVNKYCYTKVIKEENSKKFSNIELPFTQKYFIVKYNGTIKSGIDLKSCSIKITNRNIQLTIPQSKILSHYIDDNSIEVFDEHSGIFNKLHLKDMLKEISSEKNKVEKDVIKKGLLKKSNEYTKKYLKNVLSSMGFKKITLKYR